MKVIRPEIPEEIKQTSIINGFEHYHFAERKSIIDENEPQSIEDIMNDVINNNTKNVTFTITLTKKQYELWTKKGAEKWLKKALVGQANKKKSTKKR